MLKIGLFLFLIDQATKSFALHAESVEFNSGIAFGVGQQKFADAGITAWILLPVILILLLNFFRRRINVFDVAILAGGISNLFDRLYRRSVIDWIHLGTLWFNLADIYISLGVTWIFLSYLKTKHLSSLTNPPD